MDLKTYLSPYRHDLLIFSFYLFRIWRGELWINMNKNEFKNTALEIVELLELSIEHVGFPYSKREFINAFYDSKFDDEGERLKTRIIDFEYT
ncbi:hypothetical protein [Paenibacillus sp. GbtcB18]|uniref:hypothetical protein n=1 Tax=Paenibacillus sp. GbtcB18 TaxID=2824763 RepID=UPI001C30CEA2|nr:hypothetical protein [Paenibacillus sp. GbtcB18]